LLAAGVRFGGAVSPHFALVLANRASTTIDFTLGNVACNCPHTREEGELRRPPPRKDFCTISVRTKCENIIS